MARTARRAKRSTLETATDRRRLAGMAGFGRLSITSSLAGMFTAFGSFALLAALVGVTLRLVGIDSADLTANWREFDLAAALTVAGVLFVSYSYGGYVSGRMARRSGAGNGAMVFVLGVLVLAGAGAAVGLQAEEEQVIDGVRALGVPATGDDWAAIATFGGLAALASMLIGSITGGMWGERWHGRLLSRALDPSIGDAGVEAGGAENTMDLRDDTESVDADREADRERALATPGPRPDGSHFTA